MGVIRNKKAFLAFLLPGLLFYILAVFYPIEESIRLSFMKWGGIGKKQFVGLQNYVTMFHDEVFYKAFFNNLIYLVIVVSMQLLIGLFFAILLTYMTKHVTLVKTLYYVPCIITTVAITQLFRSMYSTEPMGLLNQILQKVGLGNVLACESKYCITSCIHTGRMEIYWNVYGYILCCTGFIRSFCI